MARGNSSHIDETRESKSQMNPKLVAVKTKTAFLLIVSFFSLILTNYGLAAIVCDLGILSTR